jgi:GH18 family chitinase
MKIIFGVFTLLAFSCNIIAQRIGQTPGNSKVLCYYNSTSFLREGAAKVTVADIEQALPLCTHLIYGFVGINAQNNKLVSINEGLDLDKGKAHFRTITALRARFPNLKILLSVGGDHDWDTREKYLTLLESTTGRITFVNSAYSMVKTYSFDGLDLAWEFPTVRPKKIRSSIGSAWSGFKSTLGISKGPVDEKSEEHRETFTALIRELKNAFRPDNFILGLTVLPNVNASLYYDVPALINNIDYVTISAFDFQTPDRNPKVADFPSPIYLPHEREPEAFADYQINYWIHNTAPPSKVNLGIATYGRIWKLTEDSTKTGVPPISETDGPAAAGQALTPGLLSWPEICSTLQNPNNAHLKNENAPLRKVTDPTKRFGTYAFRLPNGAGEYGVWVGYEDPDTVGNKAEYVRTKGLGGISLLDITSDDIRGTCGGDKFPILRAAKNRL